jgi:hypothetical protein
MHKRTVPPGGFALPGMIHDSKKLTHRDRISRKREDIDQHSVEIETPRTSKTCAKGTKTNNTEDDSLSLVDDKGDFLPQSANERLKHLTKSRPRSPARRPIHQTRDRSRSPNFRRDSFDFTLGLNNNTEPEDTNSKQSTGKTERSYSSSLNDVFGTTASRKCDVNKQQVVRGLNLSNVTMTNNEVNSAFDSYSKDRAPRSSVFSNCSGKDDGSELTQQEFNSYSDEDVGDMLMADYIDSDDSVSDDKPPLPSSPPPLDEETSSQNVIVNSVSGNTSPKVESNSKIFEGKTTSSDSIQSNVNTKASIVQSSYYSNTANNNTSPYNDIRYTKELPINDSTSVPKTKAFSLPGHSNSRHPISNLGGNGSTISQSSSRRRRFKPVSVDDVIASSESDALLKTGSFKSANTDNNDNINRTFPGSNSERLAFDSGSSTSSNKKEIDWGLRTGPLNTSFTQSTLKSGTIFDQFLKREERNYEERQSEKSDHVFQRNKIAGKVDEKLNTNSTVGMPRTEHVFVNRNDRHGMTGDTIGKFQENILNSGPKGSTSDVNTGRQTLNKVIVDARDANQENDDDENDNIYDTDRYGTNNFDFSDHDHDDTDGDDNCNDENDFKHSDSLKDYSIEVTAHHEMEGALDDYHDQSLYDNEILDNNMSNTDEDSMSNESTENEEDMDMNYTFDHTAEGSRFNGVSSPGEIILDNESHENYNSLTLSQGLYIPPMWDENGNDGDRKSKEYISDDGEGKDDDSLQSDELPYDVDYSYHDNENCDQNTGGGTNLRDSSNYLDQG